MTVHDVYTYAEQTTAAGYPAGHTIACQTWLEIEKTDGSRGMHRYAAHSQTRSRSDNTYTAALLALNYGGSHSTFMLQHARPVIRCRTLQSAGPISAHNKM